MTFKSDDEDDADDDDREGKSAKIILKSLDDRTEKDLRSLNECLFPVRYNESFYRESRGSGNCTALAYLAEDEGTLAGAIAVRLEKHQRIATKARMYIMTLGVYAMYRSRGIGSRLLTTSLNEASEDENVVDAYLHVQTNNDLAIKFYCDRFGFERGDVIEKYYKRIEPDSAVVLRLDMSTWKRRSIENARFDYDNSIE